jgi:hypothetical protein
MPPVDGSPFCFAHAPERAAARAAARKAGGRHRHAAAGDGARTSRRAAPITLGSVADVRAVLERVTGETLALGNSPARSRTVGALLGVALKAMEVGALEDRIAALEERLSGNYPGPRKVA